MPVVPIGLNLEAWKNVDRPSSGSNGSRKAFDVNQDKQTFTVIKTPKYTEKSLQQTVHQSLVSPVQRMVEQTKEKERITDIPDDTDLSLNAAATSETTAPKRRKKQKKSPKSHKKKPVSTLKAIKRLQKTSQRQSASRRRAGKNSKK